MRGGCRKGGWEEMRLRSERKVQSHNPTRRRQGATGKPVTGSRDGDRDTGAILVPSIF